MSPRVLHFLLIAFWLCFSTGPMDLLHHALAHHSTPHVELAHPCSHTNQDQPSPEDEQSTDCDWCDLIAVVKATSLLDMPDAMLTFIALGGPVGDALHAVAPAPPGRTPARAPPNTPRSALN